MKSKYGATLPRSKQNYKNKSLKTAKFYTDTKLHNIITEALHINIYPYTNIKYLSEEQVKHPWKAIISKKFRTIRRDCLIRTGILSSADFSQYKNKQKKQSSYSKSARFVHFASKNRNSDRIYPKHRRASFWSRISIWNNGNAIYKPPHFRRKFKEVWYWLPEHVRFVDYMKWMFSFHRHLLESSTWISNTYVWNCVAAQLVLRIAQDLGRRRRGAQTSI